MSLVVFPRQVSVDLDGVPRVAAEAYFYAAGTTTPIATYTTAAYAVEHTNPVESVSSGHFPAIYVNPGVNATFKLVLKDEAGNTIYTEDNIPALGFTVSDIGATLYPRTTAEIAAGVTPTNYQYPPGLVDRYGTNTSPGTTDMGAAIQSALTVLLNGGEAVTFNTNTVYRSNQALALTRSSAGHSINLLIEGNGATISFPAISGSTVGLTIGATSTAYFLENGFCKVNDLYLIGPETGSALTDAATTTTTGLLLSIAGRVEMNNVQVRSFYKNICTTWAFPLKASNCAARGGWIGLHLDESSNLQEWSGLHTPNCLYPLLIKSTTTSFDSGKSNNILFTKWWCEGSVSGAVIDSGAGGAGAVRFRGIRFVDPYITGITYDMWRIGTQWTFATPGTRGSNCSEFINDVVIQANGGLINPAGGVWSATQACIAFDSATRVRHVDFILPVESDSSDGDVLVGAPAGGRIVMFAYPQVSDGVRTEYYYDNGGSIARKHLPNGNVIWGAAKGEGGSIAEVGAEITNGGRIDAVADAGVALRLGRNGSDGTIASLYNDGVLAGAVNVVGATVAYLLDVANNVGIFTGSGSPEGAVIAGVGSMYLNRAGGTDTTMYTKNSGAGNTGWVAVDNV
jgi:hypothetical protein